MSETNYNYIIGDTLEDRRILGLAVGIDARYQRASKPLNHEMTELEVLQPVMRGVAIAQAIPMDDLPQDITITVSMGKDTYERLRHLAS